MSESANPTNDTLVDVAVSIFPIHTDYEEEWQ